ncbi:hypothetical protein N7492_005430 [Penicillium capsulatum]|uniref:Uncharacterized protein n=1 Tax=Penicillium capsulatum TaxID=69766 RepID=A0A9W9IDD7_9EURO|nr:hypothetical protein N7492_005430 [Penicillium capsulatum]KAJ6135473.1 hypothetical protein N7512_000633 [Penicillium capsulatum]
MSDPRLVDMEPGGESTQYESIRLYTESPPKQTGQLDGGEHTTSARTTSVSSVDEPVVDDDTLAQRLGAGIVETSKENQDFEHSEDMKSRRQQGYGPGSNVGA